MTEQPPIAHKWEPIQDLPDNWQDLCRPDLHAVHRQWLAERKLDVERRKLQLGLSSAFQLGRFEDDLVNAQRRELDAVARYRDSLGFLDRTLGTTLDRWGIGVEQVGR